MKYSEVIKEMRDFNRRNGIERKADTKKLADGSEVHMTARVVIADSRLSAEAQKLPIEQKTYEFTNYNKALTSGDGGYSIFAYCNADGDLWRIEQFSDKDIASAEIVEVVE